MNHGRRALFLGLVLAIGAPALADRRAALLVGENLGDEGEAALRFAESDAARLREVLVETGGVAAQDAHLIQGTTAKQLREVLAATRERLVAAGFGREDRLYVYVSSHARAGELHLNGTRFAVAELRAFLDSVPVGIAVLILDSCDAGAATRAKGVVIEASPSVRIERPSLVGRVVIASAGAREASFEADDWGGSLFTQNLVAGLRGAADASHDGRVTLQEAYAYAYQRTVESSAAVGSARQTPVFDLDLTGEGELVVAELRRGRARIELALDEPGEWLVASEEGAGALVRVVKSVGPTTLVLAPGRYRLRARRDDVFLEKIVRADADAEVVVTPEDLRRWRVVEGGRKGGPNRRDLVLTWGAVGRAAVPDVSVPLGWAAGWRREDASGGLLALSIGHRVGRAAGAFVQREIELTGGVGWHVGAGPLVLRSSIDAAGLLVSQEGLRQGPVLGLQPRVGLTVGFAAPVLGALVLDVALTGGIAYVRSDQGEGLRATVAAMSGLGWQL